MRKVVLWGHQPSDYKEMFALEDDDLHKKILEFGCGPSAVNADLANVTSADPLFVLDKDTLTSKISLLFAEMLKEIQLHADRFNFKAQGGLERIVWKRKLGIETFLADYESGLEEGRYVPVRASNLDFSHFQFDYALSSHYLFAGLDDQSIDFHVDIISELARVAKEVRIFPLVDRHGEVSEFLGPVLLQLQNKNFGTEVKDVDYSLQKTGNAMLRVWSNECSIEK